jgi:crotonobetainyl-CoA:carnitine CoA-transferase CaiB-like acyl-CoA transferase
MGRAWVAPPVGAHGAPANPLSGLYRTADGRYLSFVMLQPGKFWADVCRHIDRPELADDPRFGNAEQLAAHAGEAAKLLQEVIAGRDLAEWAERFATLAGPWAPVQDTLQAGNDAQVRANEYILPTGELELVSSPPVPAAGLPCSHRSSHRPAWKPARERPARPPRGQR